MAYKGKYVKDLPDWKPEENKVKEPPEAKKTLGWDVEEKPPAQWFNWLHRGLFYSIKDLDDALDHHERDQENPHQVTHQQTAPQSVDIRSLDQERDKHISNALARGWENHKSSTANPHQVTAAQIGAKEILAELKKVDGENSGLDADTLRGRDLDKELDAKVKELEEKISSGNSSLDGALASHKKDKSNPHQVTAAQLGGAKILEELKKVDGEKSGLDADKLDGKEASTFANASHNHDNRYYTEGEVNIQLKSKSDTNHSHDERYYTEEQINSKLDNYAQSNVNNIIVAATAPSKPSKYDLWVKLTAQAKTGLYCWDGDNWRIIQGEPYTFKWKVDYNDSGIIDSFKIEAKNQQGDILDTINLDPNDGFDIDSQVKESSSIEGHVSQITYSLTTVPQCSTNTGTAKVYLYYNGTYHLVDTYSFSVASGQTRVHTNIINYD